MEINWTALTYAVIALFALAGFFKGWWKEAIVTAFLAVLVFLLRYPSVAETVIDVVNQVIELVWGFIPDSILPTLESVFNVPAGQTPLINASDPGTWLVIMIFFIAAAIIVSRSTLPNHGSGGGYEVRPMGSILGGLLGGLNGFIIMGLIREYLIGTNLPGGTSALPTEITGAGGQAVGLASSGVVIRATEVPSTTLLDSYLPWLLIIIGLAVFVVALKNRVAYSSKDGYRKFSVKQPYGYRRYGA